MMKKSLASLLAVFACQAAMASAPPEWWDPQLPPQGTLFEEILDLRQDKLTDLTPPATQGETLSLAYTRLDVVVYNGVAIQRLLGIVHNHAPEGSGGQGYSLALPLLPDTTITGFTLWDQGRRLPATIEERSAAEAAYTETTGDEAPSMNKDPGLVRQVGNRFEMRLFPIAPGESKQFELYSHRRLLMKNGQLTLELPLGSLTRSQDDRHPGLISRRTEVSVYLKDELPIEAVDLGGAAWKETRLDEHRRLLKLEGGPAAVEDLALGIRLTQDQPVHATSLAFQDHFLTRVLLRPDGVRKTAANAAQGRFYLGVWRTGEASIEAGDLRVLAKEIAAFMTLAAVRKADEFQGSYRPPTFKGLGDDKQPSSPFRGSAATRGWTSAGTPEAAFKQAFENKEPNEPTNAPTVDVLDHLKLALDEGSRQAYLFLDPPAGPELERLAGLIESFGGVTFVLVTDGDELAQELLGLPNVSHFSLGSGWKKLGALAPPQSLVQPVGLEEFAAFGFDPWRLLELWGSLPNRDADFPSWATQGPVRLKDVRVYTSREAQGHPELVWVSGAFEGSGEARASLENPGQELTLSALGNPSAQPGFSVDYTTHLRPGSEQNRFVASFHARVRADAISARLQALRMSARGQSLAEASPLRREVVELSRTYGFISSETAFIALPPDLQEKYGFTAQQAQAGSLYDLKDMKGAGLPEPEEWALLLLGLLVVWRVATLKNRSKSAPLPYGAP